MAACGTWLGVGVHRAASAQSRDRLLETQGTAAPPPPPCRRYTQDGLRGLASLKNADRAAATMLLPLVQEGLLEVHLGLVEKFEAGAGDEEEDYYGPGG